MFASLARPEIAIPLVALGLFCYFRSLTRWTAAPSILALVFLFGGMVAVRLGSSALAVLFRDFFVVVPLYIALFATAAGRDALIRMPADLALSLAVMIAYTLLSALNPVETGTVQVLIGLKVWLFYLPFVAVGIALARRSDALFQLFRTLLVGGLVVSGIGLLQLALIHVMGYHAAIALFLGAKGALRATQGFESFRSLGLYRIPSTFSFVAQYVGFLYLFLTVAMITATADPDSRFRRLGQAAFFVALLAGLLSGTRGALLTFPAIVVGFAAFGLIGWRLILAAPVAAALVIFVAGLAGVDLLPLLATGEKLASHYGGEFVPQQLSTGVHFGAFGAGVGASTGATRFAIEGTGNFAPLGLESYYAKIAAELGNIGLAIFAVVFAVVVFRVVGAAIACRRTPANALVAPLAVYLVFTLIGAFKSPTLDVDPANVFFWLSLGVVVEVARQYARPAEARPPRAVGVALPG
jgi:hypothetical protein